MNDSIEEQSIEVKALENFLLYIKFKNNIKNIFKNIQKRGSCIKIQ